MPIVPVDVSDSDALEIAIIENVQREDLNAMEEAQGYHALVNEFKRSQDEIAKIVGKSRSHVANMMRLTKLPAEVQAYIASGQLSAGHARALIGVPDPAAAAKRIVEEGLNVRQAEALAHVEGVPVRKPQKARGGKVAKDPDTVALEKRVSDALGLEVNVEHRDPGGTVAHPLPRPRSARRDRAAAGQHRLKFVIRACAVSLAPHNDSVFKLSRYPRRFAFTAIDSSVRCAITAASEACLRMSSAAAASCSMTATSRAALKLRSAVSTLALREKCSRGKPLSSKVETGVPSADGERGLVQPGRLALGGGNDHAGIGAGDHGLGEFGFDQFRPAGERAVDDRIDLQFRRIGHHRHDILERDLALAMGIEREFAQFVARGLAVAAEQGDQRRARVGRDAQV